MHTLTSHTRCEHSVRLQRDVVLHNSVAAELRQFTLGVGCTITSLLERKMKRREVERDLFVVDLALPTKVRLCSVCVSIYALRTYDQDGL